MGGFALSLFAITCAFIGSFYKRRCLVLNRPGQGT
jgi:hypothetical protein